MPEGTRRSTYRLYIDDSGTKEYAPERNYNSGNTRYFVLGGVLTSIETAREISSTLCSVKREYFGTDEVEIKSNWLRIPKERKKRYLLPYGMEEHGIRNFVEEYYSKLEELDFVLIACVVDKLHMAEDYQEPWYAPAVAYELMIQRAQREMEGKGFFSVEIDNMTGATPKHRQYSENLRQQHAKMRQHGSSLQRGMAFDRLLGSLRFVDSAQSELVQVADIAAYNVFRQFTEYGEEWESASREPKASTPLTLPTYQYFRRLGPKFRASPTGRIQGYGVVKMPLRNRIQWGLRRRRKRQGAP